MTESSTQEPPTRSPANRSTWTRDERFPVPKHVPKKPRNLVVPERWVAAEPDHEGGTPSRPTQVIHQPTMIPMQVALSLAAASCSSNGLANLSCVRVPCFSALSTCPNFRHAKSTRYGCTTEFEPSVGLVTEPKQRNNDGKNMPQKRQQ